MLKISFAVIVTLGLSACMSGGTGQSAALLDTHSATCDNANLRTANGLPMRCGPQAAKPYTYQ